MRIRQAHHRQLRSFLVEDYQATNVHLEPTSGSHMYLVCFINGERKKFITAKRKVGDGRGIENDVARIRDELGAPIPRESKEPTNLEALTMAAEQEAHRKNGHAPNGHDDGTKALARRVVASIGNLPETTPAASAAPEPARVAPEPIRPLNAVFASSIAIHGDDVSADYDIIFKSRRKQVTSEGAISVFNRPVACITIPGRTVLELFDALEPVVEILRPSPPPLDERVLNLTLGLTADGRLIEPPKPVEAKKQGKLFDPSLTPRGYEDIMAMALKLKVGRDQVIAEVGATTGGGFNKPMGQWLRENGLDKLPQHVRNDLIWIGKNLDALTKWAEGRSLKNLAKMPPSGLIRRYQQTTPTLPPPAPPPAPEPPLTILQAQQQKTKVVKRSHHKKKPPIETPKILEASEPPKVETPILEGGEPPKILEAGESLEQIPG